MAEEALKLITQAYEEVFKGNNKNGKVEMETIALDKILVPLQTETNNDNLEQEMGLNMEDAIQIMKIVKERTKLLI